MKFNCIPNYKADAWVEETSLVITTHMLHIPTVVFQSHGQDQREMSDNCFSVENRISLVQASQTPVQHHLNSSKTSTPKLLVNWGNQFITNQSYTYNTDMVTIVKPVPYLYTTARNKPIQPLTEF